MRYRAQRNRPSQTPFLLSSIRDNGFQISGWLSDSVYVSRFVFVIFQLLSLLYKFHLRCWTAIVSGCSMLCPNECFAMSQTICSQWNDGSFMYPHLFGLPCVFWNGRECWNRRQGDKRMQKGRGSQSCSVDRSKDGRRVTFAVLLAKSQVSSVRQINMVWVWWDEMCLSKCVFAFDLCTTTDSLCRRCPGHCLKRASEQLCVSQGQHTESD